MARRLSLLSLDNNARLSLSLSLTHTHTLCTYIYMYFMRVNSVRPAAAAPSPPLYLLDVYTGTVGVLRFAFCPGFDTIFDPATITSDRARTRICIKRKRQLAIASPKEEEERKRKSGSCINL